MSFPTWKISNSSQLVLSVIFTTQGSQDPYQIWTTISAYLHLPLQSRKIAYGETLEFAKLKLLRNIVNIRVSLFQIRMASWIPVLSFTFQNKQHDVMHQNTNCLSQRVYIWIILWPQCDAVQILPKYRVIFCC